MVSARVWPEPASQPGPIQAACPFPVPPGALEGRTLTQALHIHPSVLPSLCRRQRQLSVVEQIAHTCRGAQNPQLHTQDSTERLAVG